MEKKLLLEQFNKDFAAMQRGMMMQFDKLPLPVYVLRAEADADGVPQDFIFVYDNSACAEFLGVRGKNTLLGMSFYDVFHNSDTKWLTIYAKTALEGTMQTVEAYSESLKKYISVDCYQPMYGYCGCFMRDITPRKDIERRLREEKERYRMVMESSTDLLFEYDIVQDIMYSWGMGIGDDGKEEMKKNHIAGYLQKVAEENLVDSVTRKAWLLILKGERQEETLEIRMRRYTDSDRHHNWYMVQARTVYEQGRAVRIAGTMRNVESWKRLQQEKQRVENLNYEINYVLGDIYYAVVHFDLDAGTYSFVELTDQKGVDYPYHGTCDEFLEYTREVLTKEDWRKFKQCFSQSEMLRALTKNGDKIEIEVRRKIGDVYKWCQVMASYLPDFSGSKKQQAILVARFIDDERRRQMEQQQALKDALVAAHSANEAKSVFLSRMSHDIRTPINAILGMTTIAQKNIDDRARVWDCLEKISTSSEHLLELINGVLNMSKIESGKVKLAEDEVILPELLENVLSIVRPMAIKKKQQLKVEFKDLVHESVCTDKLHIKQILLNIIGNAVKYTPAGGEIVCTLQEAPLQLQQHANYIFVISDNGIGIAESLLPKIFGMFERGEDSRVSKIEGTGLGLAICKNLANLMNGTIEAANRPEGGARFAVTLPLRWLRDDEKQQSESVITQQDYNFAGRRILLVEDNELNMEIAREFLTSLGAVCTEASNGRQAVDLLAASLPGYYEMILMDVRMPVMNGYDATRAIRQLERSDAQTIPIIAMTADAFSSDVRMAHQVGMNEHLSKPISIEKLGAVMARWLK